MDLFTRHPRSVGETYIQHMGQALSFGAEMIVAGFACLLHGFLPFLFTATGKNTINRLHRRMVTHRDRRTVPADQSGSGDRQPVISHYQTPAE